jgi:hypothetical protein
LPCLGCLQSNKLFNVGSLLKNKQYDHPYFLPTALRKPSFEWVYAGGMAGPGAVGHIDILCQCSWALQIQGTKRWWLRSPLLESLDGASDARVGGAGQSLEFLQKPGEMFFFCPGWWHSTYVEEPDDEANANAAGEAEAEAGSGWKKTKKKQVESLSLHAYVDLRPVGWGGDKAGTGALEQTDLLRTSIGGALAHSARGTEYAWTLTNSSYENKRDPTMLDQLVRLVCRQRACTAATDLQTDSLHRQPRRPSESSCVQFTMLCRLHLHCTLRQISWLANLQAFHPLTSKTGARCFAAQVYSCGAEWGVTPPSVIAQFRAFVMTPECSMMLVIAICTGKAAGWTVNRYRRLRFEKEAELDAKRAAAAGKEQ